MGMVAELCCGCCLGLDGISYWRQLNSLHIRENGEGKSVVVGKVGWLLWWLCWWVFVMV